MNRRELLKVGALAAVAPKGLMAGPLSAAAVPDAVMAEFQGVASALMDAEGSPDHIYLTRGPVSGAYYACWTHPTGVVCKRRLWAK